MLFPEIKKMKIKSFLANYKGHQLQNDSRKVKPGDIFLAYPGHNSDGRDFIADVIKAGACGIIYENNDIDYPIASLAVDNLAKNLSFIATEFYNNPAKNIYITALTGTNGKTTICYLLTNIYQSLAQDTAYIGTLGYGKPTNLAELNNTTPDALELTKIFNTFKGYQNVIMEVSSHALVQDRVTNIAFKQAIYTNLSHEHLDYHRTMTNYAKAKAKLFAYPSLESIIINNDDNYKDYMITAKCAHTKLYTYGFSKSSDVRVINYNKSFSGSEIIIASIWGEHKIFIPLLGKFNVLNALAIFTALAVRQIPIPKIIAALGQLADVPGRMQKVAKNVLVDYSHTPDALENALSTLKEIAAQKLWVVFGCGGNRDKAKRPLMAKIAQKYADKIVITSDNPRFEKPSTIIENITTAITKEHHVEICRKKAIHYALANANNNDIILIAGKGHENYQIINNHKSSFSDTQVVLDYYNGSNSKRLG